MNPDLLRQRRNLIAISVVLLIFDFAQIRITKVSILGTELLVGSAQTLMYFAWVLLIYFSLRYYQYLRAEPEQHIRAAFKERLDMYARSYTKVRAIQDSTGQVFDNYKITRTGFASWSYTLQGYNPVEGHIKEGETSFLPKWRLIVWFLKSIAYIAFHTTHATDHVLPFALAIAAPTVKICTLWLKATT